MSRSNLLFSISMGGLLIATLFGGMVVQAGEANPQGSTYEEGWQPSWDGNHIEAKSESWAWMGHLNEIKRGPASVSGEEKQQLGSEGLAFIHYYTRNDAGLASLTFRSSGLTWTKNKIGQKMVQETTYGARTPDFSLRTSNSQLDIRVHANGVDDVVKAIPLTEEDLQRLNDKLLPLFPGLHILPHFRPTKTLFRVHGAQQTLMNLTFYGLWPSTFPPGLRMKFYGVEDSYSFSHPMILAYGTIQSAGGKIKEVAGLVFADRQWSLEYFGKYLFQSAEDLLKVQEALAYSHFWSAFIGQNPENNDWIFVHSWQQYHRTPGQVDERVSDSNVIWSFNGQQQPIVPAEEVLLSSTKFVETKKNDVLLNYAVGRKGFFPFAYELTAMQGDFQYALTASPPLQSLDQPIYLFEGHASGRAQWAGAPYEIWGRLESSRLLFRDQDYREILTSLEVSQSEDQAPLKNWLQATLKKPVCQGLACLLRDWEKAQDQIKFVFNDMRTKLGLFFNQQKNQLTPVQGDQSTYY